MWLGILMVMGGPLLAHGWECPPVGRLPCSCDLPHTLRCTLVSSELPTLATALRDLPPSRSVSLLDCTVQHLTALTYPVFQGASLEGLVVSSGELEDVSPQGLTGLPSLLALGLPNNKLTTVPSPALAHLRYLTRLDLSHNLIPALYNHTFEDLKSLRFLDLSSNRMRIVESGSLKELNALRVVRLQDNSLDGETVSRLEGLDTLQELDLSGNRVSGPLGSGSLPRLGRLSSLALASNHLTSVTKGAFTGLHALTFLDLSHNLIDVLEDHAFRETPQLETLILAYNRMVAVSGESLSHLGKLRLLDVSHNFLRALTPDLVRPLHSLIQLNLDDNDISMVASDALVTASRLTRLTLKDNPLNCDCSLAWFADWLNNSSLPKGDKVTAVCATPPSLENGLVEGLKAGELVCQQQQHSSHPMPLSGTRLTLRGFDFDGHGASLLWSVDADTPYLCEALFIYEELGAHEVLLGNIKLHCKSSSTDDPRVLPLFLQSPPLQTGHRYRYCVVLIEKSNGNESALVAGCSEVLTLAKRSVPQITSVLADNSQPHTQIVSAKVWPQHINCTIVFQITVGKWLSRELQSNCSSPKRIFTDLPAGPSKLCASVANTATQCVWTVTNRKTHFPNPPLTLFLLGLIGSFLILTMFIIYRCLRKILNRSKLHEQYFLPSQTNDHAMQNTRYVKLQTTTKL